MDDPAVVAAIAAGKLDGLATALDRYAAALYDYCYAIEPAVAAEAVRDTFVVAWSSIDRLRNPAKLYPWLQAVAANECLRRAPVGIPAGAQAGPAPDPTPPPDLPGQVLSACADNTSVGRAYRVSVTYQAGPFGRDGFPKAGSGPGIRRVRPAAGPREGLRRRRRPVGTVAAVAVLVAGLAAAATVLAGLPSAGPRHERAAGDAAPAPGAAPASDASVPTTPARPDPSSRSGRSSPLARARGATRSPTNDLAAGTPTPGTVADPTVMPMKTVVPRTTPPAPAVPGVLSVNQIQLNFVSMGRVDSTSIFVITAKGGPVTGYTIAVPPGLPGSLTVSPSSGSLAAGESATIAVTAASTVPFLTSLTVNPGGTVVTVDVKVNPPAGGTKSPA